MSETANAAFFYRKKSSSGKGSRNETPVALAFQYDGSRTPSSATPVTRIFWRARAFVLLKEIATAAAQNSGIKGMSLPYGELRASLQIALPRVLLIDGDLGLRAKSEADVEKYPFLIYPDQDPGALQETVVSVLMAWLNTVLSSWAVRYEVDESLLDGFAEEVERGNAVTTDINEIHSSAIFENGASAFQKRLLLVQFITECLEGAELFEGLGRVYRIVTPKAFATHVEFETWPIKTESDARYSMVARLNITSVPWSSAPVITLSASRRRWVTELPPPDKIRYLGRRTTSGHLLQRTGAPIAVSFNCSIRQGVIEPPFSDGFIRQALKVGIDISADMDELIRQGGRDPDHFIGLLYDNKFKPTHPVGQGVSTRDLLDLFDRMQPLLTQRGFAPIAFHDIGKLPSRSTEYHKAVKLEMVLGEIARNLGHNSFSDRALKDALASLDEGLSGIVTTDEKGLESIHAAREELLRANSQRISRSFDKKPKIVLLARTEQERDFMAVSLKTIAGDSIELIPYVLPDSVHGPRRSLPGADKSGPERFDLRLDAWRATAEALRDQFDGCHVLVQAALWYEKQRDDDVNKYAGRCALATIANANSQYLLPPERGEKGQRAYLIRLQAALYDLIFGHSGLITEIRSLVDKAFPDDATRPKSVLGISVVSQSKDKYKRPGGVVYVATRVDVHNGRTQARLGWIANGQIRWKQEWQPFFEVLKQIAEISPAKTAKNRAAESQHFQAFVRSVLDEVCTEGDRPLVLIDSSNASSLWSWLDDTNLRAPVTLCEETFDPASRWPGLRLVRVRTDNAGRVVLRKTTQLDKLSADDGTLVAGPVIFQPAHTVTNRVVRLQTGAHYWAISKYLEQIPRGLSVYRRITATVKLKKDALPSWAAAQPGVERSLLGVGTFDLTKSPYRLPSCIDLTVALKVEEDDADAIAAACNSLRYGYGHSASETTLPAPLSFESKIRDYMGRFVLDDDAPTDPPRSEEPSGDADVTDESLAEPLESIEPDVDEGKVSFEQKGGVSIMADLSVTTFGQPTAESEKVPPKFFSEPAAQMELFVLLPGYQKSIEQGLQIDITSPINPSFSSVTALRMEPVVNSSGLSADGLLALPSFVTLEWVQANYPVPPRDIRLVHEFFEKLSEKHSISPLPWPAGRRPTATEFAEIIVTALREPKLFSLFRRALYGDRPSLKKKYALFGVVNKAVTEARRVTGDKQNSFAADMALLVKEGHLELARATMLIYGVCYQKFKEALEASRSVEELAELTPYLLAAEELSKAGNPPGTEQETMTPIPSDAFSVPADSAASPPQTADATIMGDPEEPLDHVGDNVTPTPSPVGGADLPPQIATQASSSLVHVTFTGETNSDPMQEARLLWAEHLAKLSLLATNVAADPPSQAVLTKFNELLQSLDDSYRKFEAARPKGVLIDHTLERLRLIADHVLEILKNVGELGIPGAGFLILEKAIPSVEQHLTELDRQHSNLLLTKAEADDKRASLDYMDPEAIEHLRSLAALVRERANECLKLLRQIISEIHEASLQGAQDAQSPPNLAQPNTAPEADGRLSVRVSMGSRVPIEHGPIMDGATGHPPPPEAGEPTIAEPKSETVETPTPSEQTLTLSEGGGTPYPDDVDLTDDEIRELQSPTGAHTMAPDPAASLHNDPSVDSEAMELDQRIVAVFQAGNPSLAWLMLKAANEVFSNYAFSLGQPELRLFAIAGHINHAALQSDIALLESLADALNGLARFDDVPDPLRAQRAFSLFLASLEIAIFQPNRIAVDLMEKTHEMLPASLSSATFRLKDAVLRASRSGFVITPPLLWSVEDYEALEKDQDLRRAAITTKLDAISRLHFPFVIGSKVRVELCKPEEPVGVLRHGLSRGDNEALRAVQEFKRSVGTRAEALRLLTKLTERVAPRDVLDGSARERLVGHLLDLARLCVEYEESLAIVPTTKNPRQKEIAKELRVSLLNGLKHALSSLHSLPSDFENIDGLSARWERILTHFQRLVEGPGATPRATDHLFALHAATLFVPTLDIGRGWLPEPYDPNEILASTMELKPSIGIAENDTTADFLVAARARMRRGSFGGARLLMQSAVKLGIPEDSLAELEHEWEADVATRRESLKIEAQNTRRIVERIQRYGEGLSPEDAQALLSQIDAIESADLPVTLEPEERLEDTKTRAQVSDLSVAESLLEEIRLKARAALSQPRQVLEARLDALMAKGQLSPFDAQSLRSLLSQHDDLITARERLDLIEGGGVATSSNVSLHRRWAEFFPNVPDALAAFPEADRREIHKKILAGEQYGPLNFSRLPLPQRERSAQIFKTWRDIEQSFKSNGNLEGKFARMATFLEDLGFSVENPQIDAKNSKGNRLIADVRLRFSIDTESMLLPDFGSRTEGAYRICFQSSLPSEAELTNITQNIGHRAVLVFTAGTMSSVHRRILARRSITAQGGRKALVIDDAVLLYALSEPESRPLTIIECTQPFAHSQPFGDYGRYSGVPPEMFFGRNAEYSRLLEGFGSCIVYGGRRLGKTALLKHLEARENRPDEGSIVTYLAIEDYGLGRPDRPDQIWKRISERLSPHVFKEPVTKRSEFDQRIRTWLAADPTRRILLLLDEADKFVEEDAENRFQEFRALQSLMDENNRRFKFVMAGLHNVTRLVQAENSPLRQIASDPQRIGPMMGNEVASAEALIVKPLAAMGYRFENREDVWTVLSHTNYYPVLAQTFCAALVDELAREVEHRQEVRWTIPSELVRRVLESRVVKESIKEKFEHTIKELDPRYELITYIVADRSLRERSEGLVGDGMTASEIRDAAVRYWGQAGDKISRLPVIESLLDEMEGLGVVRHARGDRWALRSPSVLALLGTRDRVSDHLREFEHKEPQRAFEPKSIRRSMPSAFLTLEQGQFSPLTYGQEQDLFSGDAPIRVILGCPLSDIELVGPSLLQAARLGTTLRSWSVELNQRSLPELLAQMRSPKLTGGNEEPMFVISPRTGWTPEWLLELLKTRSVRERLARIVFIGDGTHALRLLSDDRFSSLPPSIKIAPLQLWTNSAIEELAMKIGVSAADISTPLLHQLGRFNRPIWRTVKPLLSRPNSVAQGTLVRRIKSEADISAAGIKLADLGLPKEILEILPRITAFAGRSGHTSAYEIEEGVIKPSDTICTIPTRTIIDVMLNLSLLEPLPFVEGTEVEMRQYTINPLVRQISAGGIVGD